MENRTSENRKRSQRDEGEPLIDSTSKRPNTATPLMELPHANAVGAFSDDIFLHPLPASQSVNNSRSLRGAPFRSPERGQTYTQAQGEQYDAFDDATLGESDDQNYTLSESKSRQKQASGPIYDLGNDDEKVFTVFGQWKGRFPDSEAAKAYRKQKRQGSSKPHIRPEDDPSIEEIKANGLKYVKKIYNAMIRKDKAKDNPTSQAYKRWIAAPNCSNSEVEATAHRIFDILIEQVEVGFRGSPQHDVVNGTKRDRPLEEDKMSTCAERLEYICLGLAQEKTICEDVMLCHHHIRAFVNAPASYTRRKNQNRKGNNRRRSRFNSLQSVANDHPKIFDSDSAPERSMSQSPWSMPNEDHAKVRYNIGINKHPRGTTTRHPQFRGDEMAFPMESDSYESVTPRGNMYETLGQPQLPLPYQFAGPSVTAHQIYPIPSNLPFGYPMMVPAQRGPFSAGGRPHGQSPLVQQHSMTVNDDTAETRAPGKASEDFSDIAFWPFNES